MMTVDPKDKLRTRFLESGAGWHNYRSLLLLALDYTGKGPILELGCGDGSTQLLHDYGKATNRVVWSFDNNPEWAEKYMHLQTDKHRIFADPDPARWKFDHELDTPWLGFWSVALVDHAPGEIRHKEAIRLAHRCAAVVCHDTEPAAESGYQWNRARPHFKWWAEDTRLNTGAAIASCYLDVTNWPKTAPEFIT